MHQSNSPKQFYSDLSFPLFYLYGQIPEANYQMCMSLPFYQHQMFTDTCLPVINLTQSCNLDANVSQFEAGLENKRSDDQKQQQSEYRPSGVQTDQGFKIRHSIQYCKKNTQSNIVNQVVSFICDQQRSRPIIDRYFELGDNAFQAFYLIMKKVKKTNKNYLSRKYLIDLATFESNQLAHKLLVSKPSKNCKNRNRAYVQLMAVSTFRTILRILIRYQIQNLCTSSILTSKKIKRETIIEHMERKRQFIKLINTHQAFRVQGQCMHKFHIRNKIGEV